MFPFNVDPNATYVKIGVSLNITQHLWILSLLLVSHYTSRMVRSCKPNKSLHTHTPVALAYVFILMKCQNNIKYNKQLSKFQVENMHFGVLTWINLLANIAMMISSIRAVSVCTESSQSIRVVSNKTMHWTICGSRCRNSASQQSAQRIVLLLYDLEKVVPSALKCTAVTYTL